MLKRISRVLDAPRPSAEETKPSAQLLEVPTGIKELSPVMTQSDSVQPHISSISLAIAPVSSVPAIRAENLGDIEVHADNVDALAELKTDNLSPIQTPPGRSGKHRISMYLNPFASRSSAKVSASRTPPHDLTTLPTSVPIADSIEPETLSEQVTACVETKSPKKKLSKKQRHSEISNTAAIISNILSGTPFSPYVAPTNPNIRAKQLATTQTKIAPELLHEEKANKVISEVRRLSPLARPSTMGSLLGSRSNVDLNVSSLSLSSPVQPPPAMHAVCLDSTDEKAEVEVFSELATSTKSAAAISPHSVGISRTAIAVDTDTLANVLGKINIVNFLKLDPIAANPTRSTFSEQPDLEVLPPKRPLELGDAGRDATLSGAMPSPATVIDGVNDMATTLLALGLGNPNVLAQPGAPKIDELLPDHASVYPPTDRMTVITCEYKCGESDCLSWSTHYNPRRSTNADWYSNLF